MNIIREDEKEKKKQKQLKIFYIVIISICLISILLAFIIQIINENSIVSKEKNNNKEISNLTANEISQNKEKFYEIFENKVKYLENNAYKIRKINQNEEIVYLGYQNNESKINDYELNVNIPYININDETIDQFNTQIREIFETKAKSVLNTYNNNIIYTVDYSAYVTNNILSVVIRSTLKEGANPQRDIVQTYNYDLINHKKCTIDDMLQLKGITKKDAGQKIKDEIKTVQEKVQELAKLGYTVYTRDYTSDIYNIDNVTEYFMGENNTIYVIYAYGNLNHTSEMDIVVM